MNTCSIFQRPALVAGCFFLLFALSCSRPSNGTPWLPPEFTSADTCCCAQFHPVFATRGNTGMVCGFARQWDAQAVCFSYARAEEPPVLLRAFINSCEEEGRAYSLPGGNKKPVVLAQDSTGRFICVSYAHKRLFLISSSSDSMALAAMGRCCAQ